MANARSAWGIDIGNRALKAIRVAREADGIRITDLEVIEHENILSNAGDNRETLIQSALTNFVQAHNIKKEDVAVGVSGQSSFARFIKLPPVEPRQIPSIVRFEAIQQIPFPLEEVEWSYQLFKDEASPDVEVGIFAMRKELVQEHLKYFTDAGLNVQVVQMNPLAVYNGMYFDQRLKGTTMVIDLGAENTDLIIAEGETIWLRSIPIGGNSFTEALVKSFKLRFEKAEDLKRNAATSKYGRQILQAMRPIFADLVAEIQRSIGFYASVHRDSRITKVIALGGTFRLPGLQKYLQQNLQLEVQKIDRLGTTAPNDAKVAAGLSENLLSAVGAYGLALQAIGEGKITSSLLPQAIRREREWRAKQKWFAVAAACIVGGTAITYGRLTYEQGQYNGQAAIQGEIKTVFKQASDTGTAENANIANLKSLGDYRELWQDIYTDIVSSVPPPPDTQQDPKKLGARNQREQVVIDDIKPLYSSNLSDALKLNDTDILPVADAADAAGARAAGMGGLRPGMVVTPGHVPGAVAGTTPGTTPPGDVLRGYLITIHCRTPFSNGYELIKSRLAESLQQKKAATEKLLTSLAQKKADSDSSPGVSTAAKPQYIFQRVWIARYVQLKNDTARVQQLKARAQQTAEHRNIDAPGFPGGGMGLPMRGAYPDIHHGPRLYAPPPLAPARAPGGTGLPGATGAPEDADPVDPLTNESIMADWDVIVVVAVVLDPVAPGGTGAEQPQPAPGQQPQPTPGQPPAGPPLRSHEAHATPG
jgi:type IV pilus assembly protein PilM